MHLSNIIWVVYGYLLDLSIFQGISQFFLTRIFNTDGLIHFSFRLDPVDNKLYVKYQVIGPNQVAVPTHFFKVIIGQQNNGELDIYSYLMPNEPIDNATPLDQFLVAPELIEQNVGFLITTEKIHKEKIRAINQPWIDFKLESPPPSRRQKSLSAPSSTPAA